VQSENDTDLAPHLSQCGWKNLVAEEGELAVVRREQMKDADKLGRRCGCSRCVSESFAVVVRAIEMHPLNP
jgi:hypothetical protein